MKRRTLLAVLPLFVAACDQSVPVAPTAPSKDVAALNGTGIVYTGRATALDATVLGINQKACDTGLRQGGPFSYSNSVASHSIPGTLLVKVLYCNTDGKPNRALAEAGVFELILTIGGNSIFADVLTSMAAAFCPDGVSPNYSVNLHSNITRLNVNGRAIVVSKAPNTVIPLPNGYIVINEQSSFVTPFHAGGTVTALRIVINSPVPLADILIARSQAHIDCP